jgi:uncharacterized protein (TIGR03435 family)
MRDSLAATALAVLTASVVVGQSPASKPSFDVVSIKRNVMSGPGGLPVGAPPIERPNGAMRLTGVPTITLLLRAYPTAVGGDIVGLPDWARREYYDVDATSTLSTATPEARVEMMRSMLADRFKLQAHLEMREQSVLALVLAREDGRLGAGLAKIDTDCVAKRAADRAAAEAATGSPQPQLRPTGPDATPPPCMLVSMGDRAGVTRVRGEGTMADLANLMRLPMRMPVIDRTGLAGSYRVEMTFQMPSLSAGPDAPPGNGPEVSTALNELGLKLESTKIERDTLIVDRLERPTEN